MKFCFIVLLQLLTSIVTNSSGNQSASFISFDTPSDLINREILLRLVNEARTNGCQCGTEYIPPVDIVSWNEMLERAAKVHSEDMFSKRFLSHIGSDGSNPQERLMRQAYIVKGSGENVASGYIDEKSVFQGWMRSPGHCRNIMRASVKYIGIARAGNYWTMVLAN
jgi:uncharacterized protein YkwD